MLLQFLESIPITTAKAKLSSVVSRAVKERINIVLENRGEPQVVLVPVNEYQETQKKLEQAKRFEAWQRLQALRERVRAHSTDITTEDQAEAIAVQLSSDLIGSIVEREPSRFEGLKK